MTDPLITPNQLRSYAQLPPANIVCDSDLQLYINAAHVIVEEDLSGSSFSDDRLEVIELNLAAHFATIGVEKGGLTQQMVGASMEKYQLINDKNFGLAATRFGQTALALDTSGTLAGLMASNPLKALFRVI